MKNFSAIFQPCRCITLADLRLLLISETLPGWIPPPPPLIPTTSCGPDVAQRPWKAQLGSNLLLPRRLWIPAPWRHDVLQALLAGVGRPEVWGRATRGSRLMMVPLCGKVRDQGWKVHVKVFRMSQNGDFSTEIWLIWKSKSLWLKLLKCLTEFFSFFPSAAGYTCSRIQITEISKQDDFESTFCF